MYIGSLSNSWVYAHDVSTNPSMFLQTIAFGNQPVKMDFNSLINPLYVANGGTVSVIDTTGANGGLVIGTITIGISMRPQAVRVDLPNQLVYVGGFW
ncbi:hypothetical protein COE03_24440 [Bacillus thuringiensis]|nr:hypothetical protein COE03_24440 [Bacillus thuringiensis]